MPISAEVVMPQMGESVAEGTMVRWLKRIGDAVERDEPLFEISTDKVDAEIPLPIAGVLTEVRVNEGETVAIDTVVAAIEQIDPPHAGAKTEGSKPASDDTTAITRSANASATPPVVNQFGQTAFSARPARAPHREGP
jgi:2-oxoglutarate dehydrogenase E2 component (dihydrolipoamide succinyltransferase)